MRLSVLIGLGVVGVVLALFLALSSEELDETVEPHQTAQNPPPSQVPSVQETDQVEPAQPGRPSFDVVRVNPDGNTVIAGRGAPGSTIAIMNGENLLGSVKADERGEWVFLPSKPLEPGESELTLRATHPDGTTSSSRDVVVLSVPEGEGEALALSMSEDGLGAVRALQTPKSDALDLSIGAVSYLETGQLRLSGFGPENSLILLYLDNEPIGQVRSDERAAWTFSREMIIQPGTYEIRADQVDETAKVLNRVVISYERVGEPIVIAEDQQLTIEEGNSLWRIARRVYGTGFDYAVIYQANRDQIENPDLIYPGQVITLPSSKTP